jgi:hypothetical protein
MDSGEWQPADAERVVEALRSGVPFPSLAMRLPIGRDAWLAAVVKRLNDPAPEPLIVRANYGEGKSHLLQAAAGTALAHGAAVSYVAVSREAPLDRLDQLYQPVAAGLRIPGSQRVGLEPLLERIAGRQRELESALEAYAVPERLAWAARAYVQDTQPYREELLEELSGQGLAANRLRTVLRETFGTRVRFSPLSLTKEPLGLYRLLRALVAAAGLTGFVLLLDEIELIGKTGLGARARAYAHLADLTDPQGAPLLVIAAVASNFYSDVLDERHDREQAPQWLLQRGRVAEAEQARRGVRLLEAAERLTPLARDEVERLMTAVRAAHARAYGWEPPPLSAMIGAVSRYAPGSDARLRTQIRVAVQWLDFWFQYHEEPVLRVWHVAGLDLTEEPPSSDGDRPPVTRRPLFDEA